MNKLKLIVIAYSLFVLASCSNKELYQVGKDYQKSKCIEEATSVQQHNDCLNTDKKTYEEYEKDRSDTIKK